MILDHKKFDFRQHTLIERITLRPPFTYHAIFQNQGCFVYVSGSRTHFDAPNEKREINAEEAVLLKCGTYFVNWLKQAADTKAIVYAFHLYPEILKDIYKAELPAFIKENPSTIFTKKIVPENTIRKFIENLDFYFENPSLVSEELLELKIKELLLLLIQTKNAESVYQLISTLFTPTIINIKDVVDTHLFSDLGIPALAQLCNMSLSSFKRSFKQLYGDSPVNYINSRRMERARQLLRSSHLTVSQVAYETGYSDPSYFARIFKKIVGVSPTSFR